jgi:hypothetical protein
MPLTIPARPLADGLAAAIASAGVLIIANSGESGAWKFGLAAIGLARPLA